MVDIVKQMRYFDLAISYMVSQEIRTELKEKSCYINIDPDASEDNSNLSKAVVDNQNIEQLQLEIAF